MPVRQLKMTINSLCAVRETAYNLTISKPVAWECAVLHICAADVGQSSCLSFLLLFGQQGYLLACFIPAFLYLLQLPSLSNIIIRVFCVCVCICVCVSVCVSVQPEISGMGGCIATLLTPS